MELKGIGRKVKDFLGKYKYAAIVLLIGLLLLNLPVKKTQSSTSEQSVPVTQTFDTDKLKEILQSVEGAGKVEVMLSVASGEQTVYQTDTDINKTGETDTSKTETVIVTDSNRSEAGLVKQVNPPTYLGAVVVCEGADSASVRLAITQAVAKITGLGTDSICVLKMK